MTISEALVWATNTIEENKVKGPKSSARLLLCQALGQNTTYLFTHPERELSHEEEDIYKSWVGRRAKHEPVWYIAGNKIDFYGQTFYVDQNVLIPRPETELLIEKLISEITQKFEEKKDLEILDIATGSGAIILSLANNLSAKFYASDLSEDALNIAKKNATTLGHEVKFQQGSLFAPWKDKKFDVIVTNLPYIPHEDMPYLDKDLTQYEPLMALDGGVRGLEIYEKFFEQVSEYVNNAALIYCEIGHDQGSEIVEMAKKAFPKEEVSLLRDYSGKDRIVIIEKRGDKWQKKITKNAAVAN